MGRLVGRLGNDDAAHRRHIVASPDTETPGARVREALDRLSGPDQEILRLAAWEELDAGQIAVVLDCGSRAAAMPLHRARRRLRDEIDRMRLTPPTPGRPRDPHAAPGHRRTCRQPGTAHPSERGDNRPGAGSSGSVSTTSAAVPLCQDPPHV